jgi:alkylhydroperoxidase family enzyme
LLTFEIKYRTMTVVQGEEMPITPKPKGLIEVLSEVPRSARWILPTLAAAFGGTDASTLGLRTRTLVLLRVAAVDRAPYWRLQLEAGARGLGVTEDELLLIASDEWEVSPTFSERERAAIRWADRVARRLARRDKPAYEAVRAVFTEVELVELTLLASLGAMADRLTNALRIAPEPRVGLSPGEAPTPAANLEAWSARMFDTDLSGAWRSTCR